VSASIAPSAIAPAAIAVEDPGQPEVLALLAESDAYHAALYPAESNHLLDLEALRGPGVRFLVARLEGRAVGTGGLVSQGEEAGLGWGEIKRMYLGEAARGRRLGRGLLEAIEAEARALRLSLLRLETGVKQPEALGLYRKAGYRERGPFGGYAPDPLSLFFEKRL